MLMYNVQVSAVSSLTRSKGDIVVCYQLFFIFYVTMSVGRIQYLTWILDIVKLKCINI